MRGCQAVARPGEGGPAPGPILLPPCLSCTRHWCSQAGLWAERRGDGELCSKRLQIWHIIAAHRLSAEPAHNTFELQQRDQGAKANPLPKHACNPLFCKSASHATLFHFDQPSTRTSPKYIKSHFFCQDTAGMARPHRAVPVPWDRAGCGPEASCSSQP